MSVTTWWIGISSFAILNVLALGLLALGLARNKPTAGSDGEAIHRVRRQQLLLSAAFVIGCAFRSFVPRADVQRICLLDSWVSAVMIGRSVATVAELCFAAQWALMLRALAAGPRAGAVITLSRLVLPLITVAEVCSWFATLTTNYLGNAFEESLWALVAAVVTTGLILVWPHHRGPARRSVSASIFFTASYLFFMCTVDVPMYLSRWRADEAAGRQYLSLAEGIRDATFRWVVTHRWEDWRQEMPWMSLYFIVGVWLSMALVRAPYASARAAAVAGAPADRRAAVLLLSTDPKQNSR